MLYDPKWEKKTENKTDVRQITTLIGWLEKQPASKAYDFDCCGGCLLALYLMAHGKKQVSIGGFTWSWDNWRVDEYQPPHFPEIAYRQPHTFGAALERARAAVTTDDQR